MSVIWKDFSIILEVLDTRLGTNSLCPLHSIVVVMWWTHAAVGCEACCAPWHAEFAVL